MLSTLFQKAQRWSRLASVTMIDREERVGRPSHPESTADFTHHLDLGCKLACESYSVAAFKSSLLGLLLGLVAVVVVPPKGLKH